MKFNLSLDDFSPHARAGLNFESIKWCDKLIEKYPGFKVNLFVPAGYCRLGEKPSLLSDNLNWVSKVNSLPSLNYRINLHGFYHRRFAGDNSFHKKQPPSNNDEWEHLNKDQAQLLYSKIINEFDASGIKYIKTFRPPGWKISKEAAEVLIKNGCTIAGNTAYFNKLKNKIPNIKWISYNWDLISAPNIQEKIIAYGHTSDWTTNYLNEERFNTIDSFLKQYSIEFKFIEEME